MARNERLALARLVADNDQDRCECRAWIRQASLDELLQVWHRIQQPYDDHATEIMSRFAQLAFGELLAERLDETP